MNHNFLILVPGLILLESFYPKPVLPAMSLSSLPAEVLSLIGEEIRAQELGRLCIAGNKALLQKLSSSQGIKNFACEVLPQFRLGWPYLVSQFPHLASFCFKIDSYPYIMPPVSVSFDEMPQNLSSIRLDAGTLGDDFLRYLIDCPDKFHHLETLIVASKVPFEQVLRSSANQRFDRLQKLKAFFYDLTPASLPPTLTYLKCNCRTIPIYASKGFPEGLKVLKLEGPLQVPVSMLPSSLEKYELDDLAVIESASMRMTVDDILQLPRGLKSLYARFEGTRETFSALPPTLTDLYGHFKSVPTECLPYLPQTLTSIKQLSPEVSTRALEMLPPGITHINGAIGPSIKPSDAAIRPIRSCRLRLGLPAFELSPKFHTLVLDSYDPSQLHMLPSSLTRLVISNVNNEALSYLDRPDLKLRHLAIPLRCHFDREPVSKLDGSSDSDDQIRRKRQSTHAQRNPYAVFNHLEFLFLSANDVPLPVFRSFGPHLNHIRLKVHTLPFGAFTTLPQSLHKIEVIFQSTLEQGLLHDILTTLPKYTFSFVCHLAHGISSSDLTISAFTALPRSLFSLTLPGSPHIKDQDFASVDLPQPMNFSWGCRQIMSSDGNTELPRSPSPPKGKCIVM